MVKYAFFKCTHDHRRCVYEPVILSFLCRSFPLSHFGPAKELEAHFLYKMLCTTYLISGYKSQFLYKIVSLFVSFVSVSCRLHHVVSRGPFVRTSVRQRSTCLYSKIKVDDGVGKNDFVDVSPNSLDVSPIRGLRDVWEDPALLGGVDGRDALLLVGDLSLLQVEAP